MKMQKSLLLAVAAGCAVGTAASAQELPPVANTGQVVKNPVGLDTPVGNDRAVQVVYDCLTTTFAADGGATHLGTCSQAIEDVSFAGSPWNNITGRLITEITYGVGVITTPTTTEDIMLIFWDEDNVNFQGFGGIGTNMINPAAAPLAVVRVDSAGLGAGSYWQITNALTGLAGGGVAVPDDDNGVFVQIAWVNDGFTPADTNGDTVPDWQNLSTGIYAGCTSNTDRAIVFGSESRAPQGGNAATVGTTSINYGRDISNAAMCPNIGVFIGSANPPVGAGNFENRTVAAAPQRGMMLRLKGDVPPPPAPTPRTNLGCIADTGVHTTGTVAAGGKNWYEICLNADVTDALRKFMDIDTEGSSFNGADVAIALYDSGGAVTGVVGGVSTAKDDGSGSSTDDQLSFGVGRRAAPGDGLQYDGRNGELLAGTYYLVVAPAASTFAPGFLVNSSANPGGNYNLNIATNVNTGVLAPSVAPIVNGQDYGSLGAANPGAAFTTPLRGVTWHKFVLDTAVSAPGNYLDLDMAAGSTATADTEIFLFDSNGDLVATDDDSGANALSLMSFGCAGSSPRTYGTAVETYTGQTGSTLPAGTYYLAVGLFDTTNLAANPGRFHVRGTSGSSLNAEVDLYTGTCAGCDTIDFNHDDLFPDTTDIDDFLSVFSGGPCSNDPLCGDIDFNNDGLFPDTLDIDALLSVFSGGPCLF
ncbi:MAG: hypothetical protein U0637_13585 [Phycisphaerales bacterium]